MGIGTGDSPLIIASPAPGSGGGGGGVTSLNGETGPITLTSTGNTISITPSGSTIDLEAIGGGVPGGSPTQIQFNNTGVFGGVAGSSVDSAGNVALVSSGTGTLGAALTITGDATGDSPLIVNNGSSAGTQFLSNFGGTLVNHGVNDTDGVAAPLALSFLATETDSTGSGVMAAGIVGSGQLFGTDVTGDVAVGVYVLAVDNSTGGNATEVTALQVQVIGQTGRTQLMTGLHVLSPLGSAVSQSAILIDSQAGAAAVTTDPGDPSVFGPVSIAPSGTAVALTLTGDAHISNIQNWKNNAGTLVVDINNRGGVVIAPSGVATVALSVTGDSHSSPIQAWIQNGAGPVAEVTPTGSMAAASFINGSGAGATWTSGTGAPTGTPVIGSVYSRTDGTVGSSYYLYNGTAWVALG